MPEPESPRELSSVPSRGPRSRRRIGAGVALVAGSAVVVAVVLGAGPSSSQGASKPAKSSGAATVARRDLVSTDTESGTLGYANAQTVFNRLSGTITSLPAVGRVIDPGQTLYSVDGAPVILFDGGTPAYRDMSDGVSDGLDVQELKLNLKALGFYPDHQITVNQTFDAATTVAVERWQASLGQTQTGTVTLGQIVFLPGPQRVTQVDTVLGSTGGSGGSAAAGAATTTSGAATGSTLSASTAVAAPRAEFVSLATTTPATTTTTTPTTTGTGSGKPSTTCPTSLTKQIARAASDSQTISQTKQQIAAICSQRTSSASKTAAQTLAALIALLNAETLQLQRSGAGSGAGSGTAKSGSGTGAGGGSSPVSGGGRSGGGSAASSGGSGGSASSGGSAASGGGSSSSGGGSSSGGTAQAILQTTSTQLVVSVDLDATKQSEAVVGEPVTVQLPNGDTVNGKITGVSPVAQTASSSSSSSGGGGGSSSSTPSSTVPVTITLAGHLRETGLDQAAVSVKFQQQVENNVLSVPVTALLATTGGGYAVQERSAPHTLIPVTPGLFAAGYVQVSGAGIYPGLSITDSQG